MKMEPLATRPSLADEIAARLRTSHPQRRSQTQPEDRGVRRLAKGAFALSKAKDLDGPARNKAEAQYSVRWGEAAQVLDEFRESNGGRPASPRKGSIYPLEDDGAGGPP